MTNPFDKSNELLRRQQFGDTSEYLDENQDNPNALMDVLQANTAGLNVPPQNYVEAPEETILPENYNELAQAEADEMAPPLEEDVPVYPHIPSSPQSASGGSIEQSVGTSQAAPKSREEEILERFKAMRDSNNEMERNARDTDASSKLSDTIMKGGSQIANAFANQSGYTKIDNQALPLLTNELGTAQSKGKRNLEDLMTEYKLLNDLNKGKTAGDKIYQTKQGLVKIDANGNPVEVYKDPVIQRMMNQAEQRIGMGENRLNLSHQKEGRMVEKFGFDKSQKFEDDASKALDKVRQKETWKSAEKTLSEVDGMRNLLDDAYTKGGQSLAMIGPKVAKSIAGEVGVLTESDVTRYVKNPELVKGMMDDIKKASSGKLSQASYENLKRLLDISKKSAQRKMDLSILEDATLFSRREKIPLQDAMTFLNANYVQNQGATVEVISPKGKVVNVPIEKLTDALNSGGKLKK